MSTDMPTTDLMAGRLARVEELLTSPRSSDLCGCGPCALACEAAGAEGYACETCGYRGTPSAIACQCYEYSCSGSHAGGRGSGCPHGALVCPFCDAGEMESGWEVIKELRAALGQDGRASSGELREMLVGAISALTSADYGYRWRVCRVCWARIERYDRDIPHDADCIVLRAQTLLDRGEATP